MKLFISGEDGIFSEVCSKKEEEATYGLGGSVSYFTSIALHMLS